MTKQEVRKLDRIFSQRMRENHPRCQLCGRAGKLDPHHIVGRVNRLLRWCPDNIAVLCTGCHMRCHNNPLWEVDVLSQLKGAETLDTLNRLSRLTGIRRSYEEAQEQMTWTAGEYEARYL